jgi:hypothetical protein
VCISFYLLHGLKYSRTWPSPDPLSPQGEELRLEQDVLAPLAAGKKLYVYMTTSFWRQIKSAGYALLLTRALFFQADIC